MAVHAATSTQTNARGFDMTQRSFVIEARCDSVWLPTPEDQTEREIYVMSQSLCTIILVKGAAGEDSWDSADQDGRADPSHRRSTSSTVQPGNQTVPPGVYD